MTDLWLGRWRVPTIALILFLYVILATTYSQVIPLGEAPDEAPHFTVIRYIVQNHRLPSTQEEHEAFQPPLYYLIGTVLARGTDFDDFAIKANADFALEAGAPKNLLLHTSAESFPYSSWALTWRLLRMLSVLCGAITIWAIYRLGTTLFPERPALGVTMAAVTAFIPGFLFMTSVLNNDNLATAFSALTLLQIARLVRGHDDLRNVALLGILLGLGVLSKVNVGVTAVSAGLGLAYRAWEREGSWRPALYRTLTWGSIVGGVSLIIVGWWLVRNLLLHQDLTGWSFILETNALRDGPLTPEVLIWLATGLFKSFWLAWIGIELDRWVYLLLLALCLISFGGLVRLATTHRRLTSQQLAILGLLLAQIVVISASLLQWTATVLGTDQARLLYPALPAMITFLVLGWYQWLPLKRDGWLAGGLAMAFLTLAVLAPWIYIAPVHAPPRPVPAEELADMAEPADIRFGDAIRLAGYRLHTPAMPAGGRVEIDLFWQALRPIERDLWLTLSLAQDPVSPLIVKDGSPSAGRDTTDRWKPDVFIPSTHWLPVPDHAAPGTYGIWAGIHPFGSWEWLPIDPHGEPRILLGLVEISTPP